MDRDRKLEQMVQSMMEEVDGLFTHRDKLMTDIQIVSEELKNPALALDDFQREARRNHLQLLRDMETSELQVIVQRGKEMGEIFDSMYHTSPAKTGR